MEEKKILSSIAHNYKIKIKSIFAIESYELSDLEKKFIDKYRPIGIILFTRNCHNKLQLQKLINNIKEISDGEIMILIDQEGGDVARLKKDNFNEYKSAKYFRELYKINPSKAKSEIKDNFSNMSKELFDLGININCSPVVDLLSDSTHKFLQNRIYGDNVDMIYDIANLICNIFLENNIEPILKHIPGHGKANLDSHYDLPIINNDLLELKDDFAIFTRLNKYKFAMTSHIIYSKIDPKYPATLSKKLIGFIRNEINFNNILISDDINMKALSNQYKITNITKNLFKAGCDLLLYCNSSNIEIMEEIAKESAIIDDNFRVKLIN